MSLGVVIDSAREFTIGASNVATRLMDNSPPDAGEIRTLLSSASDRDTSAGLKEILRLMSQGQSTTEFFADVVRSCHSNDPVVRDMVATYLEVYSDSEPELTLMAINALQKGLSVSSPHMRANSLKVLSSLRVVTIAPIVLRAIETLASDPSAFVKITVCRAVAKAHELDPSLSPELIDVLQTLLADRKDPRVVGWALHVIWNEFPSRLELVHPAYHYAAQHLSEFDEWCQVSTLKLLVTYCRHYMAGPDDADLAELFENAAPLLTSLNDAVVIEAAAAYFYLGTAALFEQYHVALHVCQLELSELVLPPILMMCYRYPGSFSPFTEKFLSVRPTDRSEVRTLKLKVFTALKSAGTASLTRRQFNRLGQIAFWYSDDKDVVRSALQGLALAATEPKWCRRAVKFLVRLVTQGDNGAVLLGEALVALRILIQQLPPDQESSKVVRTWTISHLAEEAANSSPTSLASEARATLIWLVGEYAREQPALAAEVLRKRLNSLADEPSACVRLQIIQLAVKLQLVTEEYNEFVQYALQLGKYDPDYDTRDRTRFFMCIIEEREIAELMLQATKPPSLVTDWPDLTIGSASLVLGHRLNGYSSLEDWQGNGDASLRAEPVKSELSSKESLVPNSTTTQTPGSSEASSSRDAITRKTKQMSLAEFLESESESGETESGSEEEGDEESV